MQTKVAGVGTSGKRGMLHRLFAFSFFRQLNVHGQALYFQDIHSLQLDIDIF